MNEIRNENFFVIQSWMVSKLKLIGNELMIYAIIYGFCQNLTSCFYGSRQYIADMTGASLRAVQDCLQRLQDKGYIRNVGKNKDTNTVKYAVIPPETISKNSEVSAKIAHSAESAQCRNCTPPVQNLHTPECRNCTLTSAESAHNNINDKLDNNIADNIHSAREEKSKKIDTSQEKNKTDALEFLEPRKDYAKTVFEIWKDGGLPCCNGNFLSFVQKDFNEALRHLRGIHSDDVIAACWNYVKVLRDSRTWVTAEFTFDAFVASKLFKPCLESNFREVNFVGKEKQKPKYGSAVSRSDCDKYTGGDIPF